MTGTVLSRTPGDITLFSTNSNYGIGEGNHYRSIASCTLAQEQGKIAHHCDSNVPADAGLPLGWVTILRSTAATGYLPGVTVSLSRWRFLDSLWVPALPISGPQPVHLSL